MPIALVFVAQSAHIHLWFHPSYLVFTSEWKLGPFKNHDIVNGEMFTHAP